MRMRVLRSRKIHKKEKQNNNINRSLQNCKGEWYYNRTEKVHSVMESYRNIDNLSQNDIVIYLCVLYKYADARRKSSEIHFSFSATTHEWVIANEWTNE